MRFAFNNIVHLILLCWLMTVQGLAYRQMNIIDYDLQKDQEGNLSGLQSS